MDALSPWFHPHRLPWMWDNITCWKPAHVGEMVLVSCPELFRIFNPDQGGFPPGASSGYTRSSLFPKSDPRHSWETSTKDRGHPAGRWFPISGSCW